MPDQESNPQHAELERRKHDLHKIYNPTSQNQKIVFNKAVVPETWTVKAHSEEIVPFYVCKKYLKTMATLINYTQSDTKTKKENERRTKAGLQPMNLYAERFRFESRSLKLTEDQYVKLMAQLYRGLYKEYGVDPEPETSPVEQSSKPAFESALDRVFAGEKEEDVEAPKTPEVAPKTAKVVAKSKPAPKTTAKANKSKELKKKIEIEMKKVSKK